MTTEQRPLLTSSHWGTYEVHVEGGRVSKFVDFAEDSDPSPIGHGLVDVLDDALRITSPMVRRGWLEGGPGSNGERRGEDEFVAVSWERVNQIVADELRRVRSDYGNQSVYAGSYGWASAGRFHHAQSQLKRFLNCIGGFTSSKNTYSFAAAEVVVPHVLGSFRDHLMASTGWETIAEASDLFVAFGGVPLKNGQISQGGTGNHVQRSGLHAAHDAGVEFVNISPLRSDVLDGVEARWLAPRPSTDVALMLALSHVLLAEGLADDAFLATYTVGGALFADYVLGVSDGVAKTPEWASAITELSASDIVDLARQMAAGRTMISVAWALTRQDHGEQTFWAAIALASLLGQIGLPGGGVGFGYSAMNYIGMSRQAVEFAAFPQGRNPVEDFIPVARVTDMLENPGGTFDYNGATYRYPDTRLIWWAGGNPFHHHQDLHRLRRAWARPDTVIVNEWCWNSVAKHADIVLPCTTTLERNDLALTSKDPYQVRMDKAIDPVGLARDDHEIFRGLARELGVEEAFTEGRSVDEWQRWMYDQSQEAALRAGVDMPDWEQFLEDGWFRIPDPATPTVMLADFRKAPDVHRLDTPSGKIELYSETISGFGYANCPGHPTWLEPVEWLGNASDAAPLHLISNQPVSKLHSQLDHGLVSRSSRVAGQEPLMMNTADAAERTLAEGQVVEVFNERGRCVAAVVISDDVRPGVVQMATGAWFDPEGPWCRNGNPNVLTLDKGTSELAQGPIAHSCLVEVRSLDQEPLRSLAQSPPSIRVAD